MSKFDLVGQTFGKLTVISFYGRREDYKNKENFWMCQCSCKSPPKLVRTSALTCGLQQSCGCAQLDWVKSDKHKEFKRQNMQKILNNVLLREKLHIGYIKYVNKSSTRKKRAQSQKEVWQRPGYRENQVQKALGRKQSPETIAKKIKATTGKKRTLETCKNISNSLKGEKNPGWKGGISPLMNMIRVLPENRFWIKRVFKKDNYTCQKCLKFKSGTLNAHHIVFFSKIIQKYNIKSLNEAVSCKELWDINNGITLCVDCHKEVHKELRDED